MTNIKFKKAILHIMDNNVQAPVLSVSELDIDNVVGDFLEKHIAKVFNDGDLKNARFNSNENDVFSKCSELSQNVDLFSKISSELANGLFLIMKQNPDIPAGDVIFVIFEIEESTYFSLMKLNYRNSFIHYVSNSDEGNINHLIMQKTTLPSEAQKIDECVIINLSNLELKILEKKYEICETKEFYLSKYFLKCQSDLSYLQKMKIIDKAVSKTSKKHFDEDFEKVTKLKSYLAKSIEENNEIKVDKVAALVFGENKEIQKQYIEEVQKAGLVENTVCVPETTNPSKKFRTQKLKTDSGIEINFPSHFYNNKDVIEFINNPDGTVSIIIKNVNKVVNR